MKLLWVLMGIFGWAQASEPEVIPFFEEKGNERFSLEIREDQIQRKLRTIAGVIQKEFGANIMVEDSANLVIKGNFSNVTLNEFLTYVLRTYALSWHRVGNILHFTKPSPPPWRLELEFQQESLQFSLDADNVPLRELARQLSQKMGKNVLAPPALNPKISGFIHQMPWQEGLAAVLAPYRIVIDTHPHHFTLRALAENDTEDDYLKPEAKPTRNLPEWRDGGFYGRLVQVTLQQAVTLLAEKAGASIRFLDTLEDTRANLKLAGEDLAGAFNIVFAGTPYSYKVVDGVHLIGTKSRPELTTSELVIAHHINAQNALAYLSGEMDLFQTFQLPSRATPLGNQTSRTSLATTSLTHELTSSNNLPFQNQPRTPSHTAPTPQGSLKKTVSFGQKVAAEMTLVREYNALLVTGTQDLIEEVKQRLALIDRPAPQVLIQALVVDFQNTNKENYGLSITNGDNKLFPEIDVSVRANRPRGGNFHIGRLPEDFDIRLQALAEEGKAKIVFKPHIATLSGHEAYIELGNTQFFRLQSETVVGDDNPRSQVSQRIETIEANISLRVIPWVTASGEITTYIEPIFNNFLGQVTDNVPPPLSTRRLQSTVRLKNGETIILGGLIEEALRKNHRGVPGLSRLPLLGHLFKNHNHQHTQSELVIYLTPYVYFGDEGSVEIQREPTKSLLSQVSKPKKKEKKRRRGKRKKRPRP